MATPKETIWEIDPHTLAKHKILEYYLNAWFPILNRYNDRIVYLDGFSGPGRYSKGEQGSPLIALTVAANHRRAMSGELVFLFIDERPDRIENLREEISRLKLPGHFKVHVEPGTFQDVMTKWLDEIESEGKNLAPTFSFIDPFGFSGLPFTLVSRILKYPKSEVLITFMVNSVNRFLEAPNEQLRRHIVDLFGTEEVLGVLDGGGNRIEKLRILYQNKLISIAQYVRFFEMHDRNDQTIYYLFFGSNHELGHLKMKEAMWRVDSEGDYRFSDQTNPNQAVLFQQDHSARLFEALRKKFFQSKKMVSELKRFVFDETAYLEKHLKESLRYAENNSMIVVDEQKAFGGKRKKGTFADDVYVTFV